MSKQKSRSTYHYERTLNEFIGGFGRRAVDGQEVGIEIEVEGTGLPPAVKGWRIVPDGSLRGESAEYIFNGPSPRQGIDPRLEAFQKAMAGVTINQSYRTSVHVHVNQQDTKLKDIYTQILLYTIWEDVLGEQCGQERVGNLFALRAKDAEFYLDRLFLASQQDYLSQLNTQDLRYTAVNPMALFTHGTLEYRSMRGTTDIKVIRNWVDLLLALKDASINNFDNPLTMVQDVSTLGPEGFAKKVFNADQIGLFTKGWQDKVIEGTRLVQHIAHANPNKWEAEPKVKEKSKSAPTYSKYTGAPPPRPVAQNIDEEINRLYRATVAPGGAPPRPMANIFLTRAPDNIVTDGADIPVEAAPGWVRTEEEL